VIAAEPNEEREQAIARIMAKTGKTREQAEAFLAMVGSAMGWRPKFTRDELGQRLDTFLAAPLTPPTGQGDRT
jgi:hypothetical protein